MVVVAFFMHKPLDPTNGGVQRSTYKLAKYLDRESYKTFVIAYKDDSALDISKDINVLWISKELDLSMQIENWVSQYKIDIFVNQIGYDLKLTKMLRSSLGAKVALINTLRINPKNFVLNLKEFTKHYLMTKKLPSWLVFFVPLALVRYRHILKQKYEFEEIMKITDKFILLSNSFVPDLHYFKISSKLISTKAVAIPNMFPFPSESHKREKENVILFVGRLNKLQKRTDLLLAIWQKLHEKHTDWDFWVVGDGPEKENMVRFCRDNGLERVKFFGFKDPNPFYSKASILHFTSAYEGFGNVLVEAQSYGTIPILFNTYSAASDIVLDGESGYLVEPYNINHFVEKSSAIMHDPTLMETLRKGAITHSKSYSIEDVSKLWFKLFDSLIEKD